MKTHKKALAALTAILMLLSLFPGLNLSSAAATQGNLTYEINRSGQAVITGFEAKPTGRFVIPDTLGGYPVTEIGDFAFAMSENLTAVQIPGSVVTIESNAFLDCTNLQEVSLSDGLRRIGLCAFENCSKLSKIHIPDSVTRIESSAFSNCTALSEVTLPHNLTTIDDSTFSGCSGLTEIKLPDNLQKIGTGAFTDCSDLKSIQIPDSVTDIDSNAFYHCRELASVRLSQNLKEIEYCAFNGCYALTQIVIPEGVTVIRSAAFADCQKLQSIELPQSLTVIEYDAFLATNNLTDVYYLGSQEDWHFNDYDLNRATVHFGVKMPVNESDEPDYIKEGNLYFQIRNGGAVIIDCLETAKGMLIIPDTLGGCPVTEIGNETFADCKELTHIILPQTVTAIGVNAFLNCYCLEQIELPDSLTEIKKYTFDHCSSLKELRIPDTVTSIGEFAFGDCESLRSIRIPDGVTSIGLYAFAGCINLSVLEIPASVTTIGKNMLNQHPGSVHIYYGGSEAEWNAIQKDENPNLDMATVSFNSTMPEQTIPIEPITVDDANSLLTAQTFQNTAPTVKDLKRYFDTNNLSVETAPEEFLGENDPIGTGSTVYITAQSYVGILAQYTVLVPSDVNGDGRITAQDARKTLRAAAKLEVIDGVRLKAADADGDGNLTASDARKILRKAANLE